MSQTEIFVNRSLNDKFLEFYTNIKDQLIRAFPQQDGSFNIFISKNGGPFEDAGSCYIRDLEARNSCEAIYYAYLYPWDPEYSKLEPTSWKELISEALTLNNESWHDVISCTLTENELEAHFYSEYGAAKGTPFTLWTNNSVYFPCTYDGKEWVERVARNPDGKPTDHIGRE